MKILHITTEDIRPGASRAAFRLNQGLNKINIRSNLLVQNKQSSSNLVYPIVEGGAGRVIGESRKLLDKTFLVKYKNREKVPFSTQKIPNVNLIRKINDIDPDLVVLHWVCDGFLQIESLARIHKPIVWVLRDMWPFTGGCHYDQGCEKYMETCGACPQLSSKSDRDLSYSVLHRKLRSWKYIDFNIIALSTWIGKCAAASSLFKNSNIEIIPNGVDIGLYRPIDKPLARKILKLPIEKKLILFGAVGATSDKRKGFHLLQAALKDLSQSRFNESFELVVFGATKSSDIEECGFMVHYLGHLSDDISLALAYSAADIFIAPSIQENLANTVLESTACGTPCIAFKIGGMPDLIEHEQNGYLARPFDVTDLAKGIIWTTEQNDRYQKLSKRARKKVEQEFTIETQAERHLVFYKNILA